MDGEPTEFKEITGSIKSVGKRFKEALKQGKNVFINIKSPLLIDDVWKKIKGELNGKKNYRRKNICILSRKILFTGLSKFNISIIDKYFFFCIVIYVESPVTNRDWAAN